MTEQATDTRFKAGDVICTDKGERLKLTASPEWSEAHGRNYAWACRWIKTKGKFSSNALLHNMQSYWRETDRKYYS